MVSYAYFLNNVEVHVYGIDNLASFLISARDARFCIKHDDLRKKSFLLSSKTGHAEAEDPQPAHRRRCGRRVSVVSVSVSIPGCMHKYVRMGVAYTWKYTLFFSILVNVCLNNCIQPDEPS